MYTALTQWLVPRLTAGRDAVSVSLGDWWSQNWWLAIFWVLELGLLFGFLAWSRRRRQRRTRQMDSVIAGLARALPSDWESARDLRVLGWHGHRPVRLRVTLTPRSPLDDPDWRSSLADAARKVLGPVAPIAWPRPSRGGVFDWGKRPPHVDLRVVSEAPAERQTESLDSSTIRTDNRLDRSSAEDLQIYRRPRPESPERVPAEHGSARIRPDRED